MNWHCVLYRFEDGRSYHWSNDWSDTWYILDYYWDGRHCFRKYWGEKQFVREMRPSDVPMEISDAMIDSYDEIFINVVDLRNVVEGS